MKRFSTLFLGLMMISCLESGTAQTKNEGITAQRFFGDVVIDSTPSHIWSVLTDAVSLTAILGYEYTGESAKFKKVGDWVPVKVWGDESNLTAVRMDPNKELRFNLDPKNGSYICVCAWKLSESGGTTKVEFEERYTESGSQTQEGLDAQVKEFNEMLGRLKARSEK